MNPPLDSREYRIKALMWYYGYRTLEEAETKLLRIKSEVLYEVVCLYADEGEAMENKYG